MHRSFSARETLGENHVAVVLSTMTWQAYNFHDDDGNGTLDTWYAGQPHARLGRPYENRGVIPHYKHYEQPFLRWLVSAGRDVDYLARRGPRRTSTTGRLAAAYDLIVFPGHHEYGRRHEFDVVTALRNRGGSLMFLSANNFFYRTVKHGNVMTRTDVARRAARSPRSSASSISATTLGTSGAVDPPRQLRGELDLRRHESRPGSRFANGAASRRTRRPRAPARDRGPRSDPQHVRGPGTTQR